MKTTTMFLGAAGILAAAAIAVSVVPKQVLAYRGNPSVHGPNYSQERHEAMEKAFETNDYESWKNLMAGRGRAAQVVNKDNFSEFAKAHELAEQGKTREAAEIRAKLGLGSMNGSGMGRWGR